jgi:hypothetical protein
MELDHNNVFNIKELEAILGETILHELIKKYLPLIKTVKLETFIEEVFKKTSLKIDESTSLFYYIKYLDRWVDFLSTLEDKSLLNSFKNLFKNLENSPKKWTKK